MLGEVADWLDVLGCPYCRGPLGLNGEILDCPACGHQFPTLDGIPSLMRQEDQARLAGFGRGYREARLREGWRPLTPEGALALPYTSPPGYLPLYWEVRRQSYEGLLRILARDGPPPGAGPAADLGAGIGWLAYRLAQARYHVLAVEISLDVDFGLGTAKVYRAAVPEHLMPVQGDLEHLPLQQESVSLAIFNASLHYARDLADTLRRAAEAIRPGGCLVVLDTPVARHPRPGSGIGDRHLGRGELQQALLAAGLRPSWIRVRRNWRWRLRQLKSWLKGDARFSFPIVKADKA